MDNKIMIIEVENMSTEEDRIFDYYYENNIPFIEVVEIEGN